MLKKIVLTFFMIISVMSFNDVMAETYFCAASKATGFSFDSKTKTWKNSNFNVDDTKYIVEKINGSWHWRKFNLNTKSSFHCKKSILNTVMCLSPDFPIFTFKLNIKTMRYIYSSIDGYDAGDIYNGTPYIEIGTCSLVNLK